MLDHMVHLVCSVKIEQGCRAGCAARLYVGIRGDFLLASDLDRTIDACNRLANAASDPPKSARSAHFRSARIVPSGSYRSSSGLLLSDRTGRFFQCLGEPSGRFLCAFVHSWQSVFDDPGVSNSWSKSSTSLHSQNMDAWQQAAATASTITFLGSAELKPNVIELDRAKRPARASPSRAKATRKQASG